MRAEDWRGSMKWVAFFEFYGASEGTRTLDLRFTKTATRCFPLFLPQRIRYDF